jgi:hypothetical protein
MSLRSGAATLPGGLVATPCTHGFTRGYNVLLDPVYPDMRRAKELERRRPGRDPGLHLPARSAIFGYRETINGI